MTALTKTDFQFEGQHHVYHGKVRDVYTVKNDLLVMIATDRISAFDVVLPRGIPHKGQILNQIASKFLDSTNDIVPNWKLATPDPMVTIGLRCKSYPVEMVVRGYLCGSAWRYYQSGRRTMGGVQLPEGMKENQRFERPIITPTTKAMQGKHDEEIDREQIILQGLVDEKTYIQLEKYTLALYERGSQIAAQRGLILVDTKYEFGHRNGTIYLIDEIHTPDSSRYFYADEYPVRFEKGASQKHLSKEFVREWLISNNFQGLEGQTIPLMTDEIVQSISDRYKELYQLITGDTFVVPDQNNISARIEQNVSSYLQSL